MYEIQPDIKWNKGSAVVWLLEMLGLITDVVRSLTIMIWIIICQLFCLFCLKARMCMNTSRGAKLLPRKSCFSIAIYG